MKKFLALLLVFALLCSAMLMLASCDDGNGPDDGTGDGPGDGPGDVPTPDGTIDIVTDPKDPEAGGESDDNYIRQ